MALCMGLRKRQAQALLLLAGYNIDLWAHASSHAHCVAAIPPVLKLADVYLSDFYYCCVCMCV